MTIVCARSPRPRLVAALARVAAVAVVAVVAVVVLLAPSRADAQIVNIQPLLAKEDKHGLSGAVDGSADWRSGTTRLLLLSGSVRLRYRLDRSIFFLTVRGDFARSAGNEFVRRHFEHARYRITIAGPFEAEAFAQYQEDVIRRLAVRAVAGIGPRLRVVRWDWFELAFGALPMLEYERLGSGPEPDAGEERYNVRVSSYSMIAVRPSPRITVAQTIYVQPRVDEIRDVRVLHELEMTATVTDHLSLKSALVSMYDSQPPLKVAPLDTTLRSSIQLSF